LMLQTAVKDPSKGERSHRANTTLWSTAARGAI